MPLKFWIIIFQSLKSRPLYFQGFWLLKFRLIFLQQQGSPFCCSRARHRFLPGRYREPGRCACSARRRIPIHRRGTVSRSRRIRTCQKSTFYNKLNPVWWLENADDPVPPAWYLPQDKHRALKWRFRNPFHNFDFYVIGVADKKFMRSGHYPERNSDPQGGWDFEVARRRLALLPYVSYERKKFNFYFGWREHGAFGVEMKFHKRPTP